MAGYMRPFFERDGGMMVRNDIMTDLISERLTAIYAGEAPELAAEEDTAEEESADEDAAEESETTEAEAVEAADAASEEEPNEEQN